VLVPGRYRVECGESQDVDDIPVESSTFKTIDRAKALALCRLAYGYECSVVDLATGRRVFPCEEREDDDACA
jgi:hypothetical protein